jgi:hypothetical protein
MSHNLPQDYDSNIYLLASLLIRRRQFIEYSGESGLWALIAGDAMYESYSLTCCIVEGKKARVLRIRRIEFLDDDER